MRNCKHTHSNYVQTFTPVCINMLIMELMRVSGRAHMNVCNCTHTPHIMCGYLLMYASIRAHVNMLIIAPLKVLCRAHVNVSSLA